MYTTAATAKALAAAVVEGLGGEKRVRVAVCPPAPYLLPVGEALRGSPVELGAQNCYPEKEGAFTGEVSPVMLADVGCRTSSSATANAGTSSAKPTPSSTARSTPPWPPGLQVILCLGETLDERKADHTEAVLDAQLTGSLAGLDAAGAEARGAGLRAGLGHRHRRQRHAGAGAAGPRLSFADKSANASARKRPVRFLSSTAAA